MIENINLEKVISRKDFIKGTIAFGALTLYKYWNGESGQFSAQASADIKKHDSDLSNYHPENQKDDTIDQPHENKEKISQLVNLILNSNDISQVWPKIENMQNVLGQKPIKLTNRKISSYSPENCPSDLTSTGNPVKPFFTFAADKKYKGWSAIIEYDELVTGKKAYIGFGKCQDTGGLIGDSSLDPEKRDIDVFCQNETIAFTIGEQPNTKIIMIPPGICGLTDIDSIKAIKQEKLSYNKQYETLQQIVNAAPEYADIKKIQDLSRLL
ncbi:hypothetical protein KJ855_02500 [Patescibacteria group bacterium]|nr:hypothetical protein [Patescibacteria group bacterium]